MNRLVIIGGFTVPEQMLEPVAESASRYADDVAVFTHKDAAGSIDRLKRAIHGGRVLTHSAGLAAVTEEMKPDSLDAVAGPETSTVLGLVASSLMLAVNHQASSIIGPNRRAHLQLNTAKAQELITDPISNLKHVKSIGEFSTHAALSAMHQSGHRVAAHHMKDDEFFAIDLDYDVLNAPSASISVDFPRFLWRGGHEELYINPDKFIDKVFLEN